MTDKSTEQLLNEITSTNDIKRLLEVNDEELLDISLKDYINLKLSEKDKSVADVIKDSGQNEYLYKVFNQKRNPSRDILISAAFGMGLDLKETQMLLRLAEFARLDPRNRRDAITIYARVNDFDIDRLNALLTEAGESTY